MKKAFYLLVACLCMLLQINAIPQARPPKHTRQVVQHKKRVRYNRNSKRNRHRKSAGRAAHKTAGSTRTSKVRYGIASYYSNKFTGRKTASGEKFSQKKLTAACDGVPFGTMIRVTNLRNNRSVIVKVNDRLHYRNRRLLDLSKAAAMELKMMPRGTVRVKTAVVRQIKPIIKRK